MFPELLILYIVIVELSIIIIVRQFLSTVSSFGLSSAKKVRLICFYVKVLVICMVVG